MFLKVISRKIPSNKDMSLNGPIVNALKPEYVYYPLHNKDVEYKKIVKELFQFVLKIPKTDEFLSPVLSDLFSVQNEQSAMNELKNFFGSTEKMNEALHAINTFGERFLPRDAFDALCSTTHGIQSVYKMMQSMEPEVKTDKNETQNLTDSDLRRMMRDPKYWRDNDVEYIRKIENGFKKLYS